MVGRWLKAVSAVLAIALLASNAAADSRIDAALAQDPPPDPDFPATIFELSFVSSGARMPGHLYAAAGEGPHPTVVLLHGFPGNERNLDLAQVLRRFGFNTLFFHYRGAWGAEGEYTVLGQLDDVAAVIAYLRDPANASRLRVDTASISLLGHSMGGFTALAAGARSDVLQCVVSLAPANLALWRDALDGPAASDAIDFAAYADTLYMLRGFSGDALRRELRQADAAALDTRTFGPGLVGKAVYLAVGKDDNVTPAVTDWAPVAAAYGRERGLDLTARLLPGDHSFSAHRLELARDLLGWMDTRCR